MSLLDTREPLEKLLFIFDRRQVIAEPVPALRIVKYLDIIEDILLFFFPGAVCLAPNSLPFQELKEALGYGVIVAVPAPAHALLQVMLVQKVAPIVAAELTTCLVPKDVLNRDGRDVLVYPDNSQFIITRGQMDQLLQRANGNIAVLEKELGIPTGAWLGRELVRIDIPDPRSLHLRMPSGREDGANALWIPGGKLPTGQLEAVVDSIPKGNYIERPAWNPKK